jgi:hypothetical protein
MKVAGDAAAMQLDQALDQGQAQAEATLRAVRRAFGLGEQVEHVRAQLGRDADPGIADDDKHAIGVDLGAQPDGAAGGCVLGRVVEQVGENLHQALFVAQHLAP